jgi:N-acetylglucosaminyldiphosphoundecaprenol N-acetyl-beta-D-mannosaminyltransferase
MPGDVPPPEAHRILGVRVDATSYPQATKTILGWAATGESRIVCLGVVASIVGALDSQFYRSALEAADLVTPDGMPLVWMLRRLGVPAATRVYGPDLTPLVLEAAETAGIAVVFYGSTNEVLQRLLRKIRTRFPRLEIAFADAPPFRSLTPAEDEAVTRRINDSGVRILFVGLGSSKQDLWMHAHRGRVQAVMLGVGAAFDFLAGSKPQAPRWMQRIGVEWAFRLATEPRRLWRRYLKQNPRFMALAIAQLFRARLNEHRRTA